MTDLEITKLCAEAMGWKHLGAIGAVNERSGDYYCMSGNNDWWLNESGHHVCGPCQGIPDPLSNDEHAMALVKKHFMSLSFMPGRLWLVEYDHNPDAIVGESDNLNRAICECVANMQKRLDEVGEVVK